MSDDFSFDSEDTQLVEPAEENDESAEPEAPALFYGSADEFVRKHLRYMYRRPVARPGRGDFRWRAAWWKSEEAISRIEALWRAWESARQDPAAGMSDWWLNHCDRQMAMLLSTSGPFAMSQDENKPGEPLPYTAPPPGYFADDRQPPEDA